MSNKTDENRKKTTGSGKHPAHWSGVFAMTLCVFALIASEFMPVSLLTPMAQTMHVTEGMAGQGIAISGAFAVVTSLFISVLAGTLNRKTLLLGLTCIMAISGAVIAMAPNYLTYMAGRSLIGIVVGGFWSMSAATAMRLVPVHRVPLALAIFNSGNALATVVAAPLGSWLGSVVGWRGAFFCLVPVAIIAFVWQLLSLPSMPVTRQAAASRNVFMLFRRRVGTLGMLGVGIFFMGQFTLFTYIRPFLETVTRVDAATVTLVLLVIGVAGFIGTTLIGRVLKRGFYPTLMAIPVLMAITALALIAFGSMGSAYFPAECRSGRRTDGGDGAAVHCPRFDGGRPAFRPSRLPEHLPGQRRDADYRNRTDLSDLAGRHFCRRPFINPGVMP